MYNPYILITAVTWLVAQLLKFSIRAFQGKLDYKLFYASGGMPSAHSAVVMSLAITTLLLDGAKSSTFGIATVLAAIVIYDALNVRRSSGEQAVAINQLFDSLENSRAAVLLPQARLREIMGHKPNEVAAGAVLGTVMAGLFSFDHLTGFINFLTTTPGRRELIVYAAIAVFLLAFGLIVRFGFPKRNQSPSYKRYGKLILVRTQIFGWLMALSAFIVYEKAAYASWRLWPMILSGLAIVWTGLVAQRTLRALPSQLAAEAEQARRSRWLTPSKRLKKNKK